MTKNIGSFIKFLSQLKNPPLHISPVYKPQLKLVQGSNDFVFDDKGKKYIDFTGGIAVNAFGHRPVIQNSIEKQANKIIHASNVFVTPPQIKLTKMLVSLANKAFKTKEFSSVFLSNSGTEANECAIKFVRAACNRLYRNDENKYEIIYCKNSFHGRTMGALSVTGQEKYQKDFKPLLPGVKCIEYNSISSLKEAASNHTAAIILEPMQGEGGLSTLTDEFARSVMECSRKYNFFIIIDEIQTGLYRTGLLFNIKKYPLTPHLITLSKALGGGLPIGAVITTKKIHDVLNTGDHGSTMGGNPVVCTAAIKTLRLMRSPLFHLQRIISHLILQYEMIRICRLSKSFTRKGAGMLVGIKLPSNIPVNIIIEIAKKKGLLILKTGENTIRLAPSLICDPYAITQGMKILRKILKTKLKGKGGKSMLAKYFSKNSKTKKSREKTSKNPNKKTKKTKKQ